MEKKQQVNLIGLVGRMRVGKDEVAQIIEFLTQNPTGDAESYNRRNGKYAIERAKTWEVKKYADKLKDCLCLLLGCTREQLEDPVFKEAELGEEWWSWKVERGKNKETGFKSTEATIFPRIHATREDAVKWAEENIPWHEPIFHPLKPTARWFIQHLGTQLIREQLHPNAWVNATFATYKPNDKETLFAGLYDKLTDIPKYPNWIISDVRFLNESEAITNRDGILIEVKRPFALRYPDYAEYGVSYGYNNQLELEHPEFHKKLNHRSEIELEEINSDYTIDNDGDLGELIDKVREILIKEGII